MNHCKERNFKKWQYKQYFFINRVPASQEFFTELYFAEQYKLRKDVDNLIIDFYSGFEPETKDEIDGIIASSLYLAAHQELIPEVRMNLESWLADMEEET